MKRCTPRLYINMSFTATGTMSCTPDQFRHMIYIKILNYEIQPI